MDILDYTSYGEIRTTCGLSSDELPDSVLSQEIYANVLEEALDDIVLPTEDPGPGPLDSRFIVIRDTAEGSRTAKEQKLYNLTRMFCAYSVAYEAVTSLSMRAPKAVSDSKVSLTRFSPESTYKDVISTIRNRLDNLKSKIENINNTEVTSLPYMTVVTPDTDPITGA